MFGEETGLVQAHVFASKTECFKCQTPKPETAKAPHFHDWICPKCNASIFASKTNCFRCHTPKDGSTQAPREFSTAASSFQAGQFTPIAPAAPAGLTVGTYNLPHPVYAEKYREPEGVFPGRSKASNWRLRAPVIGEILQSSGLDIVFLQEVGQQQLADLKQYVLDYESVHVVHPGRSACDGVAVLTKRARLKGLSKEPVACEGKLPEDRGRDYMCSAAVVVQDTLTDVRLLLASAHFYAKKSIDPQGTLLAYLAKTSAERSCRCFVWGGDCNTVYRTPPGGMGEYKTADGAAGPTRSRSGKRIDWIFASAHASVERCAETEAFQQATMSRIAATGHPPSDHYGEAMAVTCLLRQP